MFKSGRRLQESTAVRVEDVEKRELNSIISEEMSIKGDIIFKGKIRVDGAVEGSISGDYFILGEKGRVKGDVSVHTFICSGSVEGSVKGERVVFKSASSLVGKVEAKELTVEAGAVIEGEFLVGKAGGTEVIEAPFEEEAAL